MGNHLMSQINNTKLGANTVNVKYSNVFKNSGTQATAIEVNGYANRYGNAKCYECIRAFVL